MPSRNPLIIAFGHKARHGKDTVAHFVLEAFSDELRIQCVNFADPLREEVNDATQSLVRDRAISPQEALRLLCEERGVQHIKDAPADAVYPYGKQRHLLQHWGQHRRETDPGYWVEKWHDSVEEVDADIVLVTDMRYPNEMYRVRMLGGFAVKVFRPDFYGLPAEAASHISEVALGGVRFDFSLENSGSLEQLREKTLRLFTNLLRK